MKKIYYSTEKWSAYYRENGDWIKKRRRERYKENPEKERRYTRSYYSQNREALLAEQKTNNKRKEYFKKYYADLKRRVIDAYGGACQCCGDDHFEFLTLDHINGGGRKDRAHRAGAGFYAWLEKHGFPKGSYRLLCMNCNFALGIYGHCPHKAKINEFILPLKPYPHR